MMGFCNTLLNRVSSTLTSAHQHLRSTLALLLKLPINLVVNMSLCSPPAFTGQKFCNRFKIRQGNLISPQALQNCILMTRLLALRE